MKPTTKPVEYCDDTDPRLWGEWPGNKGEAATPQALADMRKDFEGDDYTPEERERLFGWGTPSADIG